MWYIVEDSRGWRPFWMPCDDVWAAREFLAWLGIEECVCPAQPYHTLAEARAFLASLICTH
jgi:hypothetical protein